MGNEIVRGCGRPVDALSDPIDSRRTDQVLRQWLLSIHPRASRSNTQRRRTGENHWARMISCRLTEHVSHCSPRPTNHMARPDGESRCVVCHASWSVWQDRPTALAHERQDKLRRLMQERLRCDSMTGHIVNSSSAAALRWRLRQFFFFLSCRRDRARAIGLCPARHACR